ncbi:hypothetical protein [Paludibaculum fermentans]|uniref:hypothetical protein n=1 Tax=Paludibaculum fermentans TaxID=1473598 RepID=UPI003EBD843A
MNEDMLYQYLCPPLPPNTVTKWLVRINRIETRQRPTGVTAAEWQGKQSRIKGRAFEGLVRRVFKYVPAFTVSGNVATTTNEIDLLVQVGLSIQASPAIRQWGPHFLCECKLVKTGINANWVGKLNSVLELHSAEVGILISSSGAPRGKVKTQIHMHAFKTPPRVIVCISLAELQECENGRNLLKLLSTRYVEAKTGAAGLITQ